MTEDSKSLNELSKDEGNLNASFIRKLIDSDSSYAKDLEEVSDKEEQSKAKVVDITHNKKIQEKLIFESQKTSTKENKEGVFRQQNKQDTLTELCGLIDIENTGVKTTDGHGCNNLFNHNTKKEPPFEVFLPLNNNYLESNIKPPLFSTKNTLLNDALEITNDKQKLKESLAKASENNNFIHGRYFSDKSLEKNSDYNSGVLNTEKFAVSTENLQNNLKIYNYSNEENLKAHLRNNNFVFSNEESSNAFMDNIYNNSTGNLRPIVGTSQSLYTPIRPRISFSTQMKKKSEGILDNTTPNYNLDYNQDEINQYIFSSQLNFQSEQQQSKFFPDINCSNNNHINNFNHIVVTPHNHHSLGYKAAFISPLNQNKYHQNKIHEITLDKNQQSKGAENEFKEGNLEINEGLHGLNNISNNNQLNDGYYFEDIQHLNNQQNNNYSSIIKNLNYNQNNNNTSNINNNKTNQILNNPLKRGYNDKSNNNYPNSNNNNSNNTQILNNHQGNCSNNIINNNNSSNININSNSYQPFDQMKNQLNETRKYQHTNKFGTMQSQNSALTLNPNSTGIGTTRYTGITSNLSVEGNSTSKTSNLNNNNINNAFFAQSNNNTNNLINNTQHLQNITCKSLFNPLIGKTSNTSINTYTFQTLTPNNTCNINRGFIRGLAPNHYTGNIQQNSILGSLNNIQTRNNIKENMNNIINSTSSNLNNNNSMNNTLMNSNSNNYNNQIIKQNNNIFDSNTGKFGGIMNNNNNIQVQQEGYNYFNNQQNSSPPYTVSGLIENNNNNNNNSIFLSDQNNRSMLNSPEKFAVGNPLFIHNNIYCNFQNNNNNFTANNNLLSYKNNNYCTRNTENPIMQQNINNAYPITTNKSNSFAYPLNNSNFQNTYNQLSFSNQTINPHPQLTGYEILSKSKTPTIPIKQNMDFSSIPKLPYPNTNNNEYLSRIGEDVSQKKFMGKNHETLEIIKELPKESERKSTFETKYNNSLSKFYDQEINDINNNNTKVDNPYSKPIFSYQTGFEEGKYSSSIEYSNLSDKDLSKLGYLLAKEQLGCRLLQKRIDESLEFADKYLFQQIIPYMVEIMNNNFGNYLVQKLLSNLKANNFKTLLDIILENFLILSFNPYGTRVVQKIIEVLSSKKHIYFLRLAMEPHIISLMTNPNSSHVIIKCITYFAENQIIYLFDIIRKHILEISVNKFGCSSIQKCLEVSPEKQKEQFISKITRLTNSLISDPYGNYVLLNVISMKQPESNKEILNRIINNNNLKALCKSKISSCVIEKCLDYCDLTTRELVIGKLKCENLIELILDPQGFYIVIKILIYCSKEILHEIISQLKSYYQRISMNVIGKRFLNKLISVSPEIAAQLTHPFFTENTNSVIKSQLINANNNTDFKKNYANNSKMNLNSNYQVNYQNEEAESMGSKKNSFNFNNSNHNSNYSNHSDNLNQVVHNNNKLSTQTEQKRSHSEEKENTEIINVCHYSSSFKIDNKVFQEEQSVNNNNDNDNNKNNNNNNNNNSSDQQLLLNSEVADCKYLVMESNSNLNSKINTLQPNKQQHKEK